MFWGVMNSIYCLLVKYVTHDTCVLLYKICSAFPYTHKDETNNVILLRTSWCRCFWTHSLEEFQRSHYPGFLNKTQGTVNLMRQSYVTSCCIDAQLTLSHYTVNDSFPLSPTKTHKWNMTKVLFSSIFLVMEFPDFRTMRIVSSEIIWAVMSHGLGVLSKLLADGSPGRQTDRDRWDAVCQWFVARNDSQVCTARWCGCRCTRCAEHSVNTFLDSVKYLAFHTLELSCVITYCISGQHKAYSWLSGTRHWESLKGLVHILSMDKKSFNEDEILMCLDTSGGRCFFFMLTAAQMKDMICRYSGKCSNLFDSLSFTLQRCFDRDWILEIYRCIVRCDSPNREQCTVLNWKLSRLIGTHGTHHIKQH